MALPRKHNLMRCIIILVCLVLKQTEANRPLIKYCTHQFYPCFYLDCLSLVNKTSSESHMLFECPHKQTFDETKQTCVHSATWSDCSQDFLKHLNLEKFNHEEQLSKIKIIESGLRLKRLFQTNFTSGLINKSLEYFSKLTMNSGQRLPVKASSLNSYNTESNNMNLTFLSNNRANLNLQIQNIKLETNSNNSANLNAKEEVYNVTIEFDTNDGNQNRTGKVYFKNSRNFFNVDSDNVKRIERIFKYKKVCYFTNWSQYRPKSGYFTPEHVDPNLCTHIVYAFAYIDNITFTLRTIEHNDLDFYKRVNDLKLKNPKLRTLLGVGGWNHPSRTFSDMVITEKSRLVFIYHAVKLLRHYNFDGIDLDWEYPADRGGRPEDKERFTLLLKEFRQAIDSEELADNREKLILSAAVAAGSMRINKAYEISKLGLYLDFINLMTFDFHGSWDGKTGLNAPLYSDYDTSSDPQFSQDWAVDYWIRNGFPPFKIVLGLPAYGRSFTLESPGTHHLGAKSVGEGTAGNYTKTPGFLSFYECCSLMNNPSWSAEWQNKSKSFYMFSGNQWVSFDDINSFRLRAAYVVAKKLGGLFVFSIDMDDFTGNFCGLGSYPLLKNSFSLLMDYMPEYYASIKRINKSGHDNRTLTAENLRPKPSKHSLPSLISTPSAHTENNINQN